MIEVLVSLLIFSFGLLGMAGMLARSLTISIDAEDRNRAALLAAIAAAAPEGRVLVFGSFHAAAAGLAVLEGGDDGRG